MKSMRTLEVIEAVSAGAVEVAEAAVNAIQKGVKALGLKRLNYLKLECERQFVARRVRLNKIALEQQKLQAEQDRLAEAHSKFSVMIDPSSVL